MRRFTKPQIILGSFFFLTWLRCRSGSGGNGGKRQRAAISLVLVFFVFSLSAIGSPLTLAQPLGQMTEEEVAGWLGWGGVGWRCVCVGGGARQVRFRESLRLIGFHPSRFPRPPVKVTGSPQPSDGTMVVAGPATKDRLSHRGA